MEFNNNDEKMREGKEEFIDNNMDAEVSDEDLADVAGGMAVLPPRKMYLSCYAMTDVAEFERYFKADNNGTSNNGCPNFIYSHGPAVQQCYVCKNFLALT